MNQLFMRSQVLVLAALLSSSYQPVNGQLYVALGDLLTFVLNLSSLQSYIFPLYPDFNIAGPNDHYDFIIIGSGPSGSVLANRLTENSKISVLLLENGEEASSATDLPFIAGAFGPTKYNYGYRTQPQPGFCKGCIDNNIAWTRGNALGGSSIINYMLYARGNRRDYDKWAAMGNPGWSYDDLLPYFIKSEDCQVNNTDTGYRGKGGYLTVSDVHWHTTVRDAFVNACQETGYNYVDYNGKEQLGVSNIQVTERQGLRCSAEKAYLRPARWRPNLKIKTISKVTKILFGEDKKTAIGVEYHQKGLTHNVFANREVISSAGALNSPHVLMLSGIGPRDQLEPLGIPVINDLQVGQKMYDHPAFPAIMYEVNESITINLLAEVINPINFLELTQGNGFFATPGGVEALAFVKVNVSSDPDPLYPDIEFQMHGGFIGSDNGVFNRKMFSIPPSMYDVLFKPLEGRQIYQAIPILLHPKSYGSIKLNSSSAFDPPLFYANYFSDPDNHDIKVFIQGIRAYQKINEAPSLRAYNATLVSIPVPGCEHEQFNSDEYWECALRTIIGSIYHMTTTCKMGPTTDKEAVVDNELRVYGTRNLRVVDTSVIPIPPSSHNVAPAYVIGEKAADLIKQYWNI